MNTDNLYIVKNNEMKNPLSNEFLKNYYLDPTSHGFSLEDNSSITGFDLIHGQCPETAIFIASKLLDRGYDVKVEKTIEKQSKGPVLHMYCVVTSGNTELFVDARGVYSDYNEFIQEFLDYKDPVALEDTKRVTAFSTIYDIKDEFGYAMFSENGYGHDYLGELVFDLVDQLFMTDGFIDVCEDVINKFINGNNIGI